MEEVKTKFFNYYVHEDYKLECEAIFKMDRVSKDFEVYELYAYNKEGECILDCLKELYTRRFGHDQMISIYHDIVETAEEQEHLN